MNIVKLGSVQNNIPAVQSLIRIINKKTARFFGVGLLNTIVGYAIFAILIFLEVPYLIALLVATVAGVTFNYFSIGRLVFKSRGGLIVFGKFIAAYVFVYIINSVGLEVLTKCFKLVPYIGQALLVPLTVLLSWLFMNYWVYRND